MISQSVIFLCQRRILAQFSFFVERRWVIPPSSVLGSQADSECLFAAVVFHFKEAFPFLQVKPGMFWENFSEEYRGNALESRFTVEYFLI